MDLSDYWKGAKKTMGLGRDWLSDHYFEQDFPFGFPSDIWRTEDGRRIPLKEMTESHILNCMKVVGEDDGWYHRFQEELFSRRYIKHD